MARTIAESFLALKATNGTKPPVADGVMRTYRGYLDGEWHVDPNVAERLPPQCCSVGWHAFPLFNLFRWWPRWTSIWVVELFGRIDYSYDKVAASDIRFVDKLTPLELSSLNAVYRPRHGWGEVNKRAYKKAAQVLGLEGLVLARIDHPPGSVAQVPRLIRV